MGISTYHETQISVSNMYSMKGGGVDIEFIFNKEYGYVNVKTIVLKEKK